MANLELPGKTIDLDEVKDLSDEDYEGLLYYAGQWDSAQQESWIEEIENARGAKKPRPKKAAEGDEE